MQNTFKIDFYWSILEIETILYMGSFIFSNIMGCFIWNEIDRDIKVK